MIKLEENLLKEKKYLYKNLIQNKENFNYNK